jgi:ATP-dependent exoDNAse (exonuclease V) beta subunit
MLEELLKPLAQIQADELKGAVERFWSGPLGSQIKKSKKIYPELPFIYKTKKGILKGQMDLLYMEPNGQWTILDYKTNQVDATGLPALSAFYRMQLALYAYIFGKLYGTFPGKGVLYFSSINETVSFDYDDAFFDGFEKTVEELYSHLS